MSRLFIYGGKKREIIDSDDEDFLYHINTGKIIGAGKIIDDLKSIHKIALIERNKYVDFIDAINNDFIKNKMIYENTISIFFFTDLFNKRTEIFDTYLGICHIIYLKKKISNEKKIDEIILINCSEMFVESLQSIFPKKRIIKKNGYHRKINLFNTFMTQCKFYIKATILLLIIRFKFKKRFSNNFSGNIFLSRYPMSFDKNFIDDKYVDYVKENDAYMVSIVTDGMHQNISIKNSFGYLNKLNNQKKEFILIDKFLSFFDILQSFVQNIIITRKFKHLLEKQYNYDGINITKYLHHELIQSMLRLPRLFMYRNSIIKSFKKNSISRFTFYLHEYSYGRFFNYMLAKYFPSIKRIGFQHGPISRRKLLYFMSENIISNNKNTNWLTKTPFPDRVLAEDDLSKKIYNEAGYRNVRIMERIYRFHYLKEIKIKSNSNKILIVSGAHDGEALLERVIKIVKSNSQNHYMFKPHQKSKIFKNGLPSKFLVSNLDLVNGHIKNYLPLCKAVMATYSSVGYEAFLLGIRVYLIFLPNRINESPLLDIYENGEKNLIEFI